MYFVCLFVCRVLRLRVSADVAWLDSASMGPGLGACPSFGYCLIVLVNTCTVYVAAAVFLFVLLVNQVYPSLVVSPCDDVRQFFAI